jgi:hypothetical protein
MQVVLASIVPGEKGPCGVCSRRGNPEGLSKQKPVGSQLGRKTTWKRLFHLGQMGDIRIAKVYPSMSYKFTT